MGDRYKEDKEIIDFEVFEGSFIKTNKTYLHLCNMCR